MKHSILFLALLLAIIAVSCSSPKSALENEKLLNDWLSGAVLPVTVLDQSRAMRCRPSMNCYTLIDANGKVYYAHNVRYLLPPVIPADSAPLRRGVFERILLGDR
jgi:hypothetical protein